MFHLQEGCVCSGFKILFCHSPRALVDVQNPRPMPPKKSKNNFQWFPLQKGDSHKPPKLACCTWGGPRVAKRQRSLLFATWHRLDGSPWQEGQSRASATGSHCRCNCRFRCRGWGWDGNACKLATIHGGAIPNNLAHRNRSDFCDLRLRCPSRTQEIARFPRQETAMTHCDLRVRWKVASDLRFQAAISESKTPSCCGISGDLAPSTRKSLAIAIVRFWCAKPNKFAEIIQALEHRKDDLMDEALAHMLDAVKRGLKISPEVARCCKSILDSGKLLTSVQLAARKQIEEKNWKSGNFPEAWGSLTPSQWVAKFVSKILFSGINFGITLHSLCRKYIFRLKYFCFTLHYLDRNP